MRNLIACLLFLTFPITHCIAAEKAKVVSVSSGNLLSVQDQSGNLHQFRLYGIEAPEDEQKMGRHAHKMLLAMVDDKNVEVKLNGGDSKGVPSADISLNGLSINAAMVKSGYAWVDPATCKSSNCSTWRDYQRYAKENKKGLWIDPEAEPPWEWRARRSKAEAIVKRVNAENEYIAYYGSLANDGYRSLWAKKSLSLSDNFSQGTDSQMSGGTVSQSQGSATGVTSATSQSQASLKSGSSSGSPAPRRA